MVALSWYPEFFPKTWLQSTDMLKCFQPWQLLSVILAGVLSDQQERVIENLR